MIAATLLRAVHSRWQLREVMTGFWHDHFNVDFMSSDTLAATMPVYDRDVIRPHCLGNFRQMLAGRLEIVASNQLGARFILARMGRAAEVEELGPPLERLSSYLAFSRQKNLGAVRDQFDRVLRQMKADGTWAGILKRGAP